MANQSRTVELQIKLAGVENVKQLEETTAEINNELKQMSTTSKEFGTLSNLAKQANSKVKEVSSSLEGVTSTEKAEAVNKLGQGMVGAFQAAAGASLIFGEKSSEELQKVIAKVGGLFAVTDGLKKITEAFSAKNIAGLKATVKGFQESSIAAKLFGTSTKAAIAATGIGLIVIILASVIANFDKVKAAAKKVFDAVKQIYPPFQLIDKIIDGIKEKFGSIGNLVKGVGAAIASIFTDQTMAEAFNETVTAAKELDKVTEEYQKKVIDTNDAYEEQLKLLEAQDGKEQEILTLKKNRLLLEKGILDKAVATNTATGDQKKRLEEVNFELELNKINQEKYTAAVKKTAIEQGKADEQTKKANKEKSDAADKAKADAVNERMDQLDRLDDARLELEYEKSKYEAREIGLNKEGELLDNNVQYLKTEKMLQDDLLQLKLKQNLQGEQTTEGLKHYFSITEDILSLEQRIGIGNLAVKNSEELKKLAEERIEIEKDLSLTADERQKRIDMLDKTVEEYTKRLKDNAMALIGNLTAEEKIQYALLDINQKKVKNELRVLDVEEKNIGALQAQVELRKIEIEAQYRFAKTEEEKIKLEEEYVKLQTEGYSLLNSKNTLEEEREVLNEKVAATDNEIYDILSGHVKKMTEIKDLQDANLTGTQKYAKKLDDFFKKYGELINGILDLEKASFELVAANHDARAAQLEKDKEKFIEDNKEKNDLLVQGYQDTADAQKDIQKDLTDDLLDLNELLADAEGQRYEDIRAEIKIKEDLQAEAAKKESDALAAKKAAEDLYNAQVAAFDAKKAAEEKKAAQVRKKAAVVEAIINTALAVLSALKSGFPLGLIMAAVFAALGAVQIATISKQPTYAKGTLSTPKRETALVGEEGPELVELPAGTRVHRNSETMAMMGMLGGVSVQKFAGGGVVQSTPATTAASASIDYTRIGDEVSRALHENPVFASWVEWNQINNNMKFITNRASLGGKK